MRPPFDGSTRSSAFGGLTERVPAWSANSAVPWWLAIFRVPNDVSPELFTRLTPGAPVAPVTSSRLKLNRPGEFVIWNAETGDAPSLEMDAVPATATVPAELSTSNPRPCRWSIATSSKATLPLEARLLIETAGPAAFDTVV